MTLNPIDPKKKLLPQLPRVIRGGKKDAASRTVSSAKSDSFDSQLVNETKRIDIVRQGRIDEVKHKLLSHAYDSSSVLEGLVDRIFEELK